MSKLGRSVTGRHGGPEGAASNGRAHATLTLHKGAVYLEIEMTAEHDVASAIRTLAEGVEESMIPCDLRGPVLIEATVPAISFAVLTPTQVLPRPLLAQFRSYVAGKLRTAGFRVTL